MTPSGRALVPNVTENIDISNQSARTGRTCLPSDRECERGGESPIHSVRYVIYRSLLPGLLERERCTCRAEMSPAMERDRCV